MNQRNTKVRYAGDRYMPMLVQVYINGLAPYPQGYRFGAGSVHIMSEEEAKVLTGETPAIVDDNTGNVITGFVVVGTLTNGLVGERYEVIDENGKPKVRKVKRAFAQPVIEVQPVIEAVGSASEETKEL